MTFIIPNLAAAAHSDQAAPDKVDFDIIGGSFSGNGIISGCAVTASAGLTVAIASGVIMVAGAVVSVTGTTKTSAAADPVSPRFDLVVVDNAGTITIQGGTAGTTPAFPAIPANSVALASLFIGALQVTTSSAEITDKRVILLNTMSVGVSTGGNTLGQTGQATNRLVFAGGTNVTLSGSTQSGSMTVTIVGANVPIVGSAIQDISTATNSGTATSQFAAHDHTHRGLRAWNAIGVASTFFGNVAYSAGSNIALSTGGNTTAGSLVIHNLLSTATTVSGVASANVVGTNSSRFALEDHQHSGVQTISQWQAGGMGGQWIAAQQNQSLPFIWRDFRSQYASASVADMFVSLSLSTSSNSSWAGVISASVGYYTRNGQTLSLVTSGSAAYQWTNTSNNSVSVLSGLRRLTIPINLNLTPGEYWYAMASNTSTTNANWFTASNLGFVSWNAVGVFQGDFLQATAGTNLIDLCGVGLLGNMPSSIAFSSMSCQFNQNPPVVIFRNLTKA